MSVESPSLPSSRAVSRDFVRPLLSLRTMEDGSITLVGLPPEQWNSETLMELAAPWPRLRRLELAWGEATAAHTAPKVHPRVVTAFLQLCPRLEALWLPKVALRSGLLVALPPVTSPRLKTLDLEQWDRSRVPRPDGVAR